MTKYHSLATTVRGASRRIATSTFPSCRSKSLPCAVHGRKPRSTASAPDVAGATASVSSPKPFSEIPGDWKGSFPLLGPMPIFMPYVDKQSGGMRTEDFMRDQYVKYGKETGVAQFGSPGEKCVLVFNESYIEAIKHEGKYPTGILEGSWPIHQYNDKYLDGVKNPFLGNGEEWRKGRMAINPYLFNIQAAKSYMGAITEAAASASSSFEDYATNGKLDDFCNLAAFDMFMAASLGIQLNATSRDPKGLEFSEKIIGGIGTMGQVTAQCPYSKYDMFKFSAWDKFTKQWSAGREASEELLDMAMAQGKGSGKGVMHGFLRDENNQVSKDAATDMNVILTFAAADTTASLINNVLTNLSRHPDAQDQVRSEMQRVLKGSDYDAEVKLPYLDQVLKESQRLTPPLPWVNVKFKMPTDLVISGYHVPKGTTLVFSHMGIANDETYAGPNPQEFRPDRFSPEAIADRKGTKAEFLDHPLCCKPFGVGARMCVGSRIAKLEYTTILCRVLQDYQLDYDAVNSQPSVRVSHPTTTEQPSPTFKITKLD